MTGPGTLQIPVSDTPRARDHQQRDRRIVAGIVFLVCSAVLGVAAWLTPDPGGVGTHTQLGFTSCSLLQTTGLPCPTCGMTTSFALAADGRVGAAIAVQPAGGVLALLTAVLAVISFHALLTARTMASVARLAFSGRGLILLASLVLLGWFYKALVMLGYL